MLHPLILTLVVLICLFIADRLIPPMDDTRIQWAIRAIIAIIAIALILSIWGIAPSLV